MSRKLIAIAVLGGAAYAAFSIFVVSPNTQKKFVQFAYYATTLDAAPPLPQELQEFEDRLAQGERQIARLKSPEYQKQLSELRDRQERLLAEYQIFRQSIQPLTS